MSSTVAISDAVEAKCDAIGIQRICDDPRGGWESYRRLTAELEWG